jgi:two-component system sensor histidine kinase ChvG
LTRRILLVNLLAPVVLMVGLFYLDRYKQGLIQAELEMMSTHAQMAAAAIGEGAVVDGESLEPGVPGFNHEMVQQMLSRLVEPARLRARLFETDGDLAADSRSRRGHGGAVHIEELPEPRLPRWTDRLRHGWERLTTWFPVEEGLPPYLDHPRLRASDFPEIISALGGRIAWDMRRNKTGGLILSVAVPVQRYKKVVGALLITGDGEAIAKSMFQVRIAILEAFLLSFGITVALSLYMAGTIARPIRRLAIAAERVRHGHGRGQAIPDLSARKDEIGELSVALKEMTEALWRRMDAIETFAADVAHEIKNPLTSLRSAVETAARIENPDHQRKLMAIIQDDVGRMDRLISDISDASRVDAEMSRIETRPVSMAHLLGALAQVYESALAERGVALRLDLPDSDPLEVPGLDSRLMQVMRNLIANALSFSPQGGVIRIAAARLDGRLRITVEDDGPGIPDNKLDAIFERFYSERPQGEKFGTHSGLGLSISRQIIEAHGGRLWAANRTGGGACFTVALPAS